MHLYTEQCTIDGNIAMVGVENVIDCFANPFKRLDSRVRTATSIEPEVRARMEQGTGAADRLEIALR